MKTHGKSKKKKMGKTWSCQNCIVQVYTVDDEARLFATFSNCCIVFLRQAVAVHLKFSVATILQYQVQRPAFLGLSVDTLQLPWQALLSEVRVLSVFTRALISTGKAYPVPCFSKVFDVWWELLWQQYQLHCSVLKFMWIMKISMTISLGMELLGNCCRCSALLLLLGGIFLLFFFSILIFYFFLYLSVYR